MKQLKEHYEKILVKRELNKNFQTLYEDIVKVVHTDYIPISVIQNKIDEIKQDKNCKYYDMFLETRDIEETISILQELLEEGNK